MERVLRFLKRTSVSFGAAEVGDGLTEADGGGAVLAGETAGDEPALVGDDAGGDSSCADEIEQTSKPTTKPSRMFIT